MRKIYKRLHSWLTSGDEEREKDVHVSDLVAPRQAFFKRTCPKDLTPAEVGYFIAGRGHGNLLEALTADPEFHEVHLEYSHVVGTADVFELGEDLIEIKTTRTWKAYDEAGIPEHYKAQLRFYVAMAYPDKGQWHGVLLVFFLNARDPATKKTVPRLKAWQVDFDDLKYAREDIRIGDQRLRDAVRTMDKELLDLCPDFMCKSCKWFLECQPWLVDEKRKDAQKGGGEDA